MDMCVMTVVPWLLERRNQRWMWDQAAFFSFACMGNLLSGFKASSAEELTHYQGSLLHISNKPPHSDSFLWQTLQPSLLGFQSSNKC